MISLRSIALKERTDLRHRSSTVLRWLPSITQGVPQLFALEDDVPDAGHRGNYRIATPADDLNSHHTSGRRGMKANKKKEILQMNSSKQTAACNA
jgi:hypothetical protein